MSANVKVWNKALGNHGEYEPVTVGEGTTVKVYTEWRTGFYGWTMDFSVSVEFLVAVVCEDGKFVEYDVARGSGEDGTTGCLREEAYALATVDAPPAMLADYAAHLANIEYAKRRAAICENGCGVYKGMPTPALIYKGVKVDPGLIGRAFWFAQDSDRVGVDPLPRGSKDKGAVFLSAGNLCALPEDLAAALGPEDLLGRPDWALGFVFALPASVTAPQVFGFMLDLAADPSKLDLLRELGRNIREDRANPKVKKGAQAELVQGVAERVGFRTPKPAPTPKAPKPRAPRAKKAPKAVSTDEAAAS